MSQGTDQKPTFRTIEGYNTPLYNAMEDVIRNGNNMAVIAIATDVELYATLKVLDEETNKLVNQKGEDGKNIINPMRNRVKKHVKGLAVTIGTNTNINFYGSANSKRIGKDYIVKPHRYAVQVNKDSCIMVHKDDETREYLRVIEKDDQPYKETFYTLDGEVIAYNDIQGTKPPRKDYVIQAETADSDEVYSVKYRVIKACNVMGVNAGKQKLTFNS